MIHKKTKTPQPSPRRALFKSIDSPMIPSPTRTPVRSPFKRSPFKISPKQNVGPIVYSPIKQKTKTKTFDRFIPNRNAMDINTSQYNIKETKFEPLDQESIAYQQVMAKACGVALEKRILAFGSEPPPSNRTDLRAVWNRPVKPKAALTKRRIPLVPEKVLDAPGLADDFYLNLLDWSSKNLLAVGLEDTVYIWNGDTGDVSEFCKTKGDDYIASVQWAGDGSYLAVGLSNGDAQIWDVDSFSKIRSMKGHTSRVGVLSWDRHILSSGARDGSIWNHDVRIANHKTAELLGHTSEVCGLKWRPDGGLLASGGNDNLVQIWDARSSVPRMTKTNHNAAVKAVSWCPWQINLLATGGGKQDHMIHFWNTSTSAKVNSIHAGSQVTSIQWSIEYKEFISSHGFPNNHLSIWSYPTLNKIADLPGHDARILNTALSPDGQTVASSASDENLKFWKVFESKKKKVVVEDELVSQYKKMTIR
ncbi:ubiquitin-protein transferase activating protein [Boothiomyces macroporosus]|uniref:Ubiquitin-protein transferase activating protein n=1 Tax=Boothiomyces macroporosus TaxID=261099 RepID=A0AAD5UL08_9FUNG|nr:ubiquitin-protein transferase activating protein [Boothiomyces macroporosus]